MKKNGIVHIGDTDMYYAAFGEGEKTLIVLPGLSDGLTTVKGKALLLAAPYKRFLRGYTVYMFSRKNKMPDGYSIADMADDQVKAMRNLGIGKAIRHPEMVEKLILAVTAPGVNETIRNVVTGWIDMAKRDDHTALMVDTAERMYSKKYLDRNRRLFPLVARLTKPSSYERFYRNAYAILDFDAREELQSITAPTLIIAGSDDKTVGNDAALALKQGIAGSTLYVYDGLGHGLFEEAKDFYDRVFDFCEE